MSCVSQLRGPSCRRGYTPRLCPPLLKAKSDGQAWLDTDLAFPFLLLCALFSSFLSESLHFSYSALCHDSLPLLLP